MQAVVQGIFWLLRWSEAGGVGVRRVGCSCKSQCGMETQWRRSDGPLQLLPFISTLLPVHLRLQGFNKVVEIQQIINGCQSGMRSLVASIRSPEDMAKLAAKVVWALLCCRVCCLLA